MRGKLRCPPTLRRLLKLRKVDPCLTGVGNNPLTITKPSQRAVSRMPKARRSRLSLTRGAGWATFPLCPPSLTCEKSPLPSFNVFLCLYKYRSFSRPFDLYYFDITFPYCAVRNRPRHNKNPRRFFPAPRILLPIPYHSFQALRAMISCTFSGGNFGLLSYVYRPFISCSTSVSCV